MPVDIVAQVAQVTLSLGDQFSRAFEVWGLLLKYSPYWAPPVLLVFFTRSWIQYVRAKFIESQDNVLLELRFPPEVYKSPTSMHAVFDGLWMRGGESTFMDRLWYGKVRLWYSFELVSIEGQAHMYIWVRSAFRRLTERTLYAYYPDLEIEEVEDYALAFPFSLERHNLYGMDFKLTNPVGLPIKTYLDYKLDQTGQDEEQKTDPIAHVFELLGTLGKGEYLWFQILARAHRKENITFGHVYNKKSYEERVKDEITKIRSNPEETTVFPDGGTGKTLSEDQKKRIQAMTENIRSSLHWDVGIRGIYIGEHEYFDGVNITGMRTVWQPFGTPGYNALVSDGDRWQDVLDYPWQDFNGMRENRMKVQLVDAYRRRSWFHLPYRYEPFIMTSAELATLFHIPGTVVQTPTIQRITSTRSQPPSNLPT